MKNGSFPAFGDGRASTNFPKAKVGDRRCAPGLSQAAGEHSDMDGCMGIRTETSSLSNGRSAFPLIGR